MIILSLLKAIGIVEIFGKNFGIRATNELIENILETNTSIKQLLKDLKNGQLSFIESMLMLGAYLMAVILILKN